MSNEKKNLDISDDMSSIKDFLEDEAVSETAENFVKDNIVKVQEEEIELKEPTLVIDKDDEELVSAIDVDESKKSKKTKDNKKIYFSIYDLLSILMSSFVIIAIIFTFAFRLVGVEGESMTNTLHPNDWLIAVSKSEYEYGDIVVITQDTYFHEPLIKRVIATEGQVIDVDYANNQFFVDGKPLDEPYVKEDFLLERAEYRQFPYTVPDGCLFCMGDNRNGSSDSRTDLVGPIDEKQILGKAVVRLIPFGDFNIYDYE